MVTGASTANLALILVDARNGVVEQTKRHSFIADLLGIKHIAVCINKMDLVGYEEDAYEKVLRQFSEFASRLENVTELTFIPISALKGDNVVDRSENMPWYKGPPLLYHLENVYVGSDANHVDARFPVQWVNRPNLDFRGFAGTVEAGTASAGQAIRVLPSGEIATIKEILCFVDRLHKALEHSIFPHQRLRRDLHDDLHSFAPHQEQNRTCNIQSIFQATL